MARITRAALHLSVEEVKARMIHDNSPLYDMRKIRLTPATKRTAQPSLYVTIM